MQINISSVCRAVLTDPFVSFIMQLRVPNGGGSHIFLCELNEKNLGSRSHHMSEFGLCENSIPSQTQKVIFFNFWRNLFQNASFYCRKCVPECPLVFTSLLQCFSKVFTCFELKLFSWSKILFLMKIRYFVKNSCILAVCMAVLTDPFFSFIVVPLAYRGGGPHNFLCELYKKKLGPPSHRMSEFGLYENSSTSQTTNSINLL